MVDEITSMKTPYSNDYTVIPEKGFFVAVIFCYLNGEVLYLLKRSYGRYRLQRGFSSRRGHSMAMTRMSVSTHVSSVGDNPNPNNGSIKKYACTRNGDTILEEQVWN